MKDFGHNKGFTLIEIIVVLIIVGILAAIALPNFYSNIAKSKAQVAFAAFEQYKQNLEVCLNKNLGNEGTCAPGSGSSSAVAIPVNDNNIVYSTLINPAATPSNGTGISAAPVEIQGELANGGAPGDIITYQRNSNGTYTPTCLGAFSGVC